MSVGEDMPTLTSGNQKALFKNVLKFSNSVLFFCAMLVFTVTFSRATGMPLADSVDSGARLPALSLALLLAHRGVPQFPHL